MNLMALVEVQFDRTIADRRYLHQHPELSNQESQTANFLREALEEAGLEVISGIGGHGLVGSFRTQNPGPSFLLRFDMDALPVEEETESGYSSTVPGVMHACGHDGHMAIGLSIARLITQIADHLRGTFHLLFQPAEEIGLGALAMISEGVLERIRPDFVLGAHLWNEKPFGWLGIKGGPLMAGSSIFEITIKGQGGHGGRPQQTKDPILAAAQLINQIQTIVSRNLDPMDSAVVSVCSIEGGTAYNIIPSVVNLKGTLRYFSAETYRLIEDRLEQICGGLSVSTGCQINLSLEGLVNSTTNNENVAKAVQEAARRLRAHIIIDPHYQTMMSEDVGVFLEAVPGCFVLVGAGGDEEGNPFAHHHPRFEFNERAMPLTAALLLQSCLVLSNNFVP